MKILVIEDEEGIADILKTGLNKEGYSVDIARDGAVGFGMVKNNYYNLVIIDYMIPSVSGRDVCKKMRESDIFIPIIMITVKNDTSDKVDILNLGVDDYITKPFALSEVISRVNALLRRVQYGKERTCKIGDLMLNLDKGTAVRAGKEVYLSCKEFEILELLFAKKNRLVSRKEMCEVVWGEDFDPFSNTVDTHISRLRKKIEKNGKSKLIHTVFGRGYMISANFKQ